MTIASLGDDRVQLHPLASLEVLDAERWYDEQISGLGDRFLVAVEAAIERVARWPDAGSPTRVDERGQVIERRIVMSGFPFAIEYRLMDRTILVLAGHHQRRGPSYWADRTI